MSKLLFILLNGFTTKETDKWNKLCEFYFFENQIILMSEFSEL